MVATDVADVERIAGLWAGGFVSSSRTGFRRSAVRESLARIGVEVAVAV